MKFDCISSLSLHCYIYVKNNKAIKISSIVNAIICSVVSQLSRIDSLI